MTNSRFLAGIVLFTIALSSCDEDTASLGNSLTDDTDKLNIMERVIPVTTGTILADSVLSRSNTCYLGKIKDPETGAFVSSDFMSQFHILEEFTLPSKENIVSVDDKGEIAASSCELSLYMKNLTRKGDTLSAMKMNVTELSTPVKEGVNYYSNYNPRDLGLLRTDGIKTSKVFTFNDLNVSDSLRNTSDYYNRIQIFLNDEYRDADGNPYKNYGTYILHQYYQHPEYFADSYQFIHHICPGFFFEITDGQGFYSDIPELALTVNFMTRSNDSIYNSSATFAGTKEVLQTIRITNDKQKLEELKKTDTCTYIKSPAGLFTEVTLPVDEIMNGHESDSLLAAKISFQRINSTQLGDATLPVPSSLLMVEEDSLYSFFEKRKLTDGKTSYVASYSSATNSYTFPNISGLITSMSKKQYTSSSNKYKVVLIPVEMVYSNSTTLTNIEHNLSVSSTKLVGGSNPSSPVTLSVVYAKFKD